MSDDNKKRVVLVARSLQMGGIERNTVNLANTLVDMGHEVHIVVFKRRDVLLPRKEVHLHHFPVDRINRLTGIGLLYDLLTRWFLATTIPRSGFVWRGIYTSLLFKRVMLRRIEREYGPVDHIIARGHGAFELLWNLRDPRFMQVIVSPVSKKHVAWLDRWYTRLLFSGKHNICNSTGVLESFRILMDMHGVESSRERVIGNPIPVDKIREMANAPAPLPLQPYIVHVGRLVKQKNQELLIRAYHQSGVSEPLVIVGDGVELPKLQDLAASLDISDKVEFVGQQTNPYPWMGGAVVFVLSSRHEGFGLVMAESLACGTPVVATDCRGGVRDVLVEEQARWIVSQEVDTLGEAIREAVKRPIEIKESWVRRFDASQIAQKFLE